MTDRKAKSKKTVLSRQKEAFRQTKEWKEFRKSKMLEQKGLDPITRRKLTKRFNLHHMLMTDDINKYKDISDPSKFVALNQQTHEVLHIFFRMVQVHGWDYVDRFVDLLKRMCEVNDYD